MKYIWIITPFITGLMLGIAQCTSRLLLVNNSLSAGFLLGGITATLYLLAVIQWIEVLKSPTSLSSAYAVVVLGVFTGILIINLLGRQENSNISVRDIAGIILISAGSALIKR